MNYITVEDVIKLQEFLIVRYGGLSGIRENSLLISSVESVYQTYDGIELYPKILDKIVHISYSLIKNHCFIDGNKRIGVMVLLYLLDINDIKHDLCNDDVIKIGLDVASGRMDKKDFKSFIKEKIEKR